MLVAIVSAVSSVMWLILLSEIAAFILNPHGRAELNRSLAQAGVSETSRTTLLVVYAVILAVPAALHAVAFYGLIALRKAGWVVAFVLAILWSCVIIGIPFVYLLWKRDNRQVYGIP